MKTDFLIDMLARQAGPAPSFPAARRLTWAIGAGLLLSGLLAISIIGPLPSAFFNTPAPWIKIAYAMLLALSGGALAARLSRPASPIANARISVISVVILMLLFGMATLITTPKDERLAAILGQTWWICPWMLMMLSLPALAAIFWVMRGLAPTRLRHAGFAAGLLAGAVGAVGYSLACPETSATFVAIWYTLGIALTAWVGLWLGPKVLRW